MWDVITFLTTWGAVSPDEDQFSSAHETAALQARPPGSPSTPTQLFSVPLGPHSAGPSPPSVSSSSLFPPG